MLDPAIVARDGKGERNRRGRRVGVQIDGDNDFIWRDPKFFRRRVDNAAVGLVRHKPIETGGTRSSRLEGRRHHVRDHADRVAKNLPSRHPQMPGRPRRGRPSIDVELFPVTSVRAKVRRENAPIPRGSFPAPRFEHHGRRPVAEENACRPVGPVKQTREGFRADDEGAPVRSRGQEFVGGGEREDEPRTDRLDVESGAVCHAQCGLDLGRDGGKGEVRRRGRDNHKIEIRSREPGVGEGSFGRIKTELRGRLVQGGDVALPYSRALHDPCVGRLQRLFEVGIADDAFGKIGAEPQDDGAELA